MGWRGALELRGDLRSGDAVGEDVKQAHSVQLGQKNAQTCASVSRDPQGQNPHMLQSLALGQPRQLAIPRSHKLNDILASE